MLRKYRPFALSSSQAVKLLRLLVEAGMGSSHVCISTLPAYRGFVLAYQPGSYTTYLTDPADVLEVLPPLQVFPASRQIGAN